VIFLVNRLGEVNAIAIEFLEHLDAVHVETLLRQCAWCPGWLEAANLSRKRRRAVELLKAR
jgi:hypothetical protein